MRGHLLVLALAFAVALATQESATHESEQVEDMESVTDQSAQELVRGAGWGHPKIAAGGHPHPYKADPYPKYEKDPYKKGHGYKEEPYKVNQYEKDPYKEVHEYKADPYKKVNHYEKDPYKLQPYNEDSSYKKDQYKGEAPHKKIHYADPYETHLYQKPYHGYPHQHPHRYPHSLKDSYKKDQYYEDPYKQDPYHEDPYKKDPYHEDPYQKDPYYETDPYSNEPLHDLVSLAELKAVLTDLLDAHLAKHLKHKCHHHAHSEDPIVPGPVDPSQWSKCTCKNPAEFSADGRGNCNVGAIKSDTKVWCYIEDKHGDPSRICPDSTTSNSKPGYYWSRYACIT